MNIRTLALFSAVCLSTTACSALLAQAPPHPTDNLVSIATERPTPSPAPHWRPRIDWIQAHQAGSVLEEGAYQHVLSFTAPLTKVPQPITTPGVGPPMNLLVQPSGRDRTPSPPIEQSLRAWTRYCNQGRGMTSDDWASVARMSFDKMPAELSGYCDPPPT